MSCELSCLMSMLPNESDEQKKNQQTELIYKSTLQSPQFRHTCHYNCHMTALICIIPQSNGICYRRTQLKICSAKDSLVDKETILEYAIIPSLEKK